MSHLDTPTKKTLRRWRRNKAGVIGTIMVILLALTAISAPWLAPYSPTDMHTVYRNQGPSWQFVFGTDRFGRDQLSRILWGARVSLYVGLISVGIGLSLGCLGGLVAGFYGGKIDSAIMRFMDILFAFPAILLALVVIAILGPSLTNTMIAIGITYIPIFTRLMRASVLSLRDRDFVVAARALGSRDPHLLWRHILPNAAAPIIVQASLALSGAILTEAALSFLGMGIQPPMPSWGGMLSESRRYMEMAPWTAIFPALAIMFTVLSFNLFGDGLRDILDPTWSK